MTILCGMHEEEDIQDMGLHKDAKVWHTREAYFMVVLPDGRKNNGIREVMFLRNLERTLDLLKVIMYNIVQNGKTAVKLELWVDKSNNNNWIKATEKIDKGGWGNNGMECGGKPDQIITWGGPIAAFRWDGATDVDIKKFSVREIVPQL